MDNEGRKLNENPKTWRAFFMNPGTGGGDLGGSEADIADGLRDSGIARPVAQGAEESPRPSEPRLEAQFRF